MIEGSALMKSTKSNELPKAEQGLGIYTSDTKIDPMSTAVSSMWEATSSS